ncbi:hypothetical protein F5Y11DRAFT_315827 [Daldinia sp. FL1419]|nr:hypothetical protein F5Y11DRAFT_315827 [Daldinia sp. FL1419]
MNKPKIVRNISRTPLGNQFPTSFIPIRNQGSVQAASNQGLRRYLAAKSKSRWKSPDFRCFVHTRSQAVNMSTRSYSRDPIEPQHVDAPLTQTATFLVVTINNTLQAIGVVRSVLSSINGLSKNVSIRDLDAAFTCTVAIGSEAWDSLIQLPRPAELHPFPNIRGQKHTAVSTPGDLLFHIRSDRRDLCFEFERQLLDALGDAVTIVDETVGFRYFDVRDLLGFVDGTANPIGPAVQESILVNEEDASSVGGSYVVVQKYVHDIKKWNSLTIEQQEAIIGRKKLDNLELDDAAAGQQQSHKSLATIKDQAGNERDILRDNMPFGSPGEKEFGTYFIGYARNLWVIEQMLQRMFIGDPPGLHDKLLDFSTALTGTTFFAPPAGVLKRLGGGNS